MCSLVSCFNIYSLQNILRFNFKFNLIFFKDNEEILTGKNNKCIDLYFFIFYFGFVYASLNTNLNNQFIKPSSMY